MMNLELSRAEHEELAKTLAIRLNSLTDEIAHTDTHDFREALKKERQLLENIRGRLN